MNIKITGLKTPKGHEVKMTHYSEHTSNKFILIVPAMGVKQNFYKPFACFLANAGFEVYTFDYFGIGLSKNKKLRNIDIDVVDWAVNDLETVVQHLYQKTHVANVSLIGHSLGGQIIGLSRSCKHIKKMVFIGSQSGYWKLWPKKQWPFLIFNWYLFTPLLSHLFQYLPSKKIIGMENLPKNVALQWASWCRNPNYLFPFQEQKNMFYSSIKAKIQVVYALDDHIAPKKAIENLMKNYIQADIIYLELDHNILGKIGHFEYFKSKFKKHIWYNIHAFFNTKIQDHEE